MEIYKLLDSIDDNLFCYIRVITDETFTDPKHKSPKRIYNFLVSMKYIRNVDGIVLLFEFYTQKSIIDVKLVQHKNCTRKIQIPKEDIHAFDRVLENFLLINKFVGTLTYYNPNDSELEEEGSVMLVEPKIGKLTFEKILKSQMNINNVIIIDVDNIII